MTHEEYINELSVYISELEDCIDKTQTLAADVLGKNLIYCDLLFLGFLDRSIELAKGMIIMLKERNLTCAGPLLRLQIDNCLRLYAVNIAENETELIDDVLKGGKISSHKDKNGQQMTDSYLAGQIEKKGCDDRIKQIYQVTSGDIHFSNHGVFQSIYDSAGDEFAAKIGAALPEKYNKLLIEYATESVHYYKLFLHFMAGAAEWKKQFDASITGKDSALQP